MKGCRDHYIGQTIIKPGITGILFKESERHLYRSNYNEYFLFNFCPKCGKDLINNRYDVKTELQENAGADN